MTGLFLDASVVARIAEWGEHLEHLDSFTPLQDFAIIMAVGAVVTILFRQLRQPVVLGYLIAGFLIGPHTLDFIGNQEVVDQFATFGILLLMFGLGLEFEIDRLRRVGPVVVIATVVEIAVMVAIGYAVGRAFGWTNWEAIYLRRRSFHQQHRYHCQSLARSRAHG